MVRLSAEDADREAGVDPYPCQIRYAIKQIETGYQALLSRQPATDSAKPGPSLLGRTLPRVMYPPQPS